MEKITSSELTDMIKQKFIDKGVSAEEISQEILKDITSKIKEEVNKDIPEEQNSENDDSENIKTINNVDNAYKEFVDDSDDDGNDGNNEKDELSTKEILLRQKEEELARKEEELARREEELRYKPEMPVDMEDKGCEQLFIFDENQISVGSEKLSNTEFNKKNNPEEKTTIKDLWLNDGKKEVELYKVKFEKIGCIKFNPFEGISTFEEKSSESENVNSPLDLEAQKKAIEDNSNHIDNEDIRIVDLDGESEIEITNMKDSIEPVKDVSNPLIKTSDINSDLERNNENNNYLVDDNALESKIENIIKKYFQKMI
jgi:hypothetical protein